MIAINDWSCVDDNWVGFRRDPTEDEFRELAPGMCLHGKVTGHPRIQDGHRAHTSKIRTINGNVVTTISESVYKLGTVLDSYSAWLEV